MSECVVSACVCVRAYCLRSWTDYILVFNLYTWNTTWKAGYSSLNLTCLIASSLICLRPGSSILHKADTGHAF